MGLGSVLGYVTRLRHATEDQPQPQPHALAHSLPWHDASANMPRHGLPHGAEAGAGVRQLMYGGGVQRQVRVWGM